MLRPGSPRKATGKTLRARREFDEPKILEIDGWTIDGGKAGPAFRGDAGQVKSIVETFGADVAFLLKSHSQMGVL